MDNVENKDSWRDIVPALLLFYIPWAGVIVMWAVSRWSNLTKWILTVFVGIIPLIILGTFSYNGFQFAKFEKSYSNVLNVQMSLDFYGISNGKYPDKLDDLKPKYIKEIPQAVEYFPTEDKKSYILKGTVEGKKVELKPALQDLVAK